MRSSKAGTHRGHLISLTGLVLTWTLFGLVNSSVIPSSSLSNLTGTELEVAGRGFSRVDSTKLTKDYIRTMRLVLDTIFGFKCTDQDYQLLSQFPECSLGYMADLHVGFKRSFLPPYQSDVCRPWKGLKQCTRSLSQALYQCVDRRFPSKTNDQQLMSDIVEDFFGLGELVVCPKMDRFGRVKDLWCKYLGLWPCSKVNKTKVLQIEGPAHSREEEQMVGVQNVEELESELGGDLHNEVSRNLRHLSH